MTPARTLSARLASLLAVEHGALADFLVALSDFDHRRLWVDLGYTSLFYYLHRELSLSTGAAFHRKVAAELLQRHPEVIEPLRDGRLCLSSVVELAKVVTPENRAEVLPRFFHCSKREAKAVAVEIRPAEVVVRREVVTAAMAGAGAQRSASTASRSGGEAFHPDETDLNHLSLVASGEPGALATRADAGSEPSAMPPHGHAGPPARLPRDEAEPLTADLRRLHITVSCRFLEKLHAAKDALSHANSGASSEQVLEAGLELLLERQAKRRGLVEKPRAKGGARPDGRGRATEQCPVRVPDYVPAAVRRAVWARDGGRCQWRLDSGGLCGSTVRLELDHLVPKARGGRSTIAGMRILCRFHNQLAARQVFGDDWMNQFSQGP